MWLKLLSFQMVIYVARYQCTQFMFCPLTLIHSASWVRQLGLCIMDRCEGKKKSAPFKSARPSGKGKKKPTKGRSREESLDYETSHSFKSTRRSGERKKRAKTFGKEESMDWETAKSFPSLPMPLKSSPLSPRRPRFAKEKRVRFAKSSVTSLCEQFRRMSIVRG